MGIRLHDASSVQNVFCMTVMWALTEVCGWSLSVQLLKSQLALQRIHQKPSANAKVSPHSIIAATPPPPPGEQARRFPENVCLQLRG